jgi:hypothetical protein
MVPLPARGEDFGVAEAGLQRHVIHLQRLAVQQGAGGLDAQALDGLGRGGPAGGGEGAGEVAGAHVRPAGQLFDVQGLAEVLAGPGQQAVEAGARVQLQKRRELRLAAGSAVVDDQLLGGLAGDVLAEVGGDHRQGQVDPGGDPGAGPDLAVADIDAVRLQPHLRIAPPEVGGAVPVGGGPATVQKSGLGQHIGAGTDAADPPGRGRAAAHEAQRRFADGRRARALAAGDHEGVQRRRLGEGLGLHPRAAGAGDQTAIPCQDADFIGSGDIPAGDLEGGDGAGDVQQLEIREDQEAEGAHGGKRGNLVICARP